MNNTSSAFCKLSTNIYMIVYLKHMNNTSSALCKLSSIFLAVFLIFSYSNPMFIQSTSLFLQIKFCKNETQINHSSCMPLILSTTCHKKTSKTNSKKEEQVSDSQLTIHALKKRHIFFGIITYNAFQSFHF